MSIQTLDNKLITGVNTDEKGNFLISKISVGTYKVIISFVGYRTKTLDKVVITAGKPLVDLKQIQLSPDSRSLKQVDVVGQKALVEDKGDRQSTTLKGCVEYGWNSRRRTAKSANANGRSGRQPENARE